LALERYFMNRADGAGSLQLMEMVRHFGFINVSGLRLAPRSAIAAAAGALRSAPAVETMLMIMNR
jgi:hypothetical protein